MAENENLNTEVWEPVEVVHGLDVGKSLLGATLGATASDDQEPDEEYATIPVKELVEVKLGRQGENDTQTVVIDCSAWLTQLPGCQLLIAATRPGEREIYLPEVSVSSGVVTWPILEQDTACAGVGRAEVRAMKDGKVKKSALFRTRIEPALEGDGSPAAPTPPNWVKLIIGSVEASQEAAEHAEELVEEATASAIYAVRFDEDQGLTEEQKATGRGNIDAASLAALEAQATATAQALAGKVAVLQGSGNAGKALVVGADGNVTTGEAGVSNEVASALLACFRNVAWLSGDGSTYYDALAAALNQGRVWQRVYTDTDLDSSLKGYPEIVNGEITVTTVNAGHLRRRIVGVADGEKQYVDKTTLDGLGRYPIPIPPDSTSVTISIDQPSGVQIGSILCRIVDGSYVQVRSFGWSNVPQTINFDPIENGYYFFYARSDSSGSTDFSADPSGVRIEFNQPLGVYTDNDVSATLVGYPEISNGNITVTATQVLQTYKRIIGIAEGIKEYVDNTSLAGLGYYPIPIPADATSAKIFVDTPSDIQIGSILCKIVNGSYVSVQSFAWSTVPQTITFEPIDDGYYFFYARNGSGSTDFSVNPSDIRIEFY